jgi:CHAT domain-containing protein/tetratricopeptide (TPR) repeat protein
MKSAYSILIIVLLQVFAVNAQTIDQKIEHHSSAANNYNHLEVIRYADELLEHFKDDTNLVFLSNNLSNSYYELGQHERALELRKENLQLTQKQFGKKNINYAWALNLLGESYLATGDLLKAEDCINESLEKAENLIGKVNPGYARVLNNSALIASNKSDYNKALLLLKECQTIYEQLQGLDGVEGPGHVRCLNAMAIAYYLSNNYEKSLEFHLECARIYKKHTSNKSGIYAQSIGNAAMCYQALGQYEEALTNYKSALTIYEEVHGKKSGYYVELAFKAAESLVDLYRPREALELHRESMEFAKTLRGENDLFYTTKLSNLATIYLRLDEKNNALETQLRCIELTRGIVGEDDPAFIHEQNNLAMIYSARAEFDKSLEILLKNIEISEDFRGPAQHIYATSLGQLAELYIGLEEYEKALEYSLMSLKSNEIILGGKEFPTYAVSLNQLAVIYSNMGDYGEAEKTQKESNEIIKGLFGEKSFQYGRQLYMLGDVYIKTANVEKALECSNTYLTVLNKEKLDTTSMYLDYLSQRGEIYRMQGDMQKSFQIDNEALELGKKIYKNNPIQLGTLKNNLALSYSLIGNFEKALQLHLETAKMYAKEIGVVNTRYATSISNISDCYINIGVLNKALEYQLECAEIQKTIFTDKHPNYGSILARIGNTYALLSNYNVAHEYYKESNEIALFNFGEDHVYYAGSMTQLAGSYMNMRENDLAQDLLLKAIKIYTANDGKKSVAVGGNKHSLAWTYSYEGDYEKALEIMIESQNISIKAFGKNSPGNATSLGGIAAQYFFLGDYDKALELRLECTRLWKEWFGVRSNAYIQSRDNLSYSYLHQQNFAALDTFFFRSSQLKLDQYKNNSSGLSTHERGVFKQTIYNDFMLLMNYCVFRKDVQPTFMLEGYNQWMELNGILSNQDVQLRSSIYNSADSSLVNLYENWKMSKMLLSRYMEMPSGERIEKGISIEEQELVVNSFGQKLSSKSDLFSNTKKKLSIKDIQKTLGNEDVYIDIIRVNKYNFNLPNWADTVYYIVYFITKETKENPEYLILENGVTLENEIYAHYNSFTSGSNKLNEDSDLLSYDYFWKPISKKLGDKKNIYVASSGVYCNVNLNALYNSESKKYLFEEKEIHLVNNGRSFVMDQQKKERNYSSKTATLLGNPSFDANITSSPDSIDYFAMREFSASTLDSLSRGGAADPLPATKIEIENIQSTLEANNWTVNVLTEGDATESAIKQVKGERVLHLATHGYFIENIPIDKNDSTLLMGMERQKIANHSLLRSGLLLSGANNTLKGEKVMGENGLLSAYEASLLDLRETELVVLSACETGRGQVMISEGVSGLRKAILDAGAENIIMSLWKVNDVVTQEFMSLFYTHWMTGITIRKAFYKTQSDMKANYPQPYYWGAFVLIGK